jgi:hypothetical protein
MQLIRRTRKYFYFGIPENVTVEGAGVKSEDGQILFDAKEFTTEDDCREWYSKNVDEQEQTGKREKSFEVRMKSSEVTDGEWEKIKSFMTDPSKFSKEDVRVYHPVLAHNFVDRDGERFPVKVLGSFSKTIVGKPLLIGHYWGPPGEGRFFDCTVEKVSIDEAVKLCPNHPKKDFRKQLEDIEGIDGSISFLKPAFYILADNEEFVRKIDAGIIKDMSIGFRANKNPVTDRDGKFKWMEYFADESTEAMEGSFVFVGSQYGAANKKSFEPEYEDVTLSEVKPYKDNHACKITDAEKYTGFAYGKDREHEGKKYKVLYGKLPDGSMEEHSFRYKKTIWTASEARAHCDSHGGAFEAAIDKTDSHVEGTANENGGTMIFKLTSIPFEKTVETNDEAFVPVIAELDEQIKGEIAKLAPVQSELDSFKAEGTLDEIKALKTVKSQVDDMAKAKTVIIEDAVRLGALSGFIDKGKLDDEKKLLSDLPVEKVLEFRTKYQEAWDKQNPPAGITPEALSGEDKVKKFDNPNSYREPII